MSYDDTCSLYCAGVTILAVGSEVQEAEDQPFALAAPTKISQKSWIAKSAKALFLQKLERVPGVASCVIG